jgi:V/A-type H+/Na+-transporting ATPase subunit I
LLLGLFLTLACAREDGTWSPAAAGKAGAEFLEGIMRLFVSTVSFARVGAFALAHAGLSAAVVDVSSAIGGVGFWIALVIGNRIIIGLEGLVTGIQTTRLILFEFFIRFFRAEGREFHPLSPPRVQASKGSTP